ACVVYGAAFELRSDRQQLVAGTTFTLHAEEEVVIGGTEQGVRAYFCVRGGIGAQRILGSHSGLEPVRAGQEFGCVPAGGGQKFLGPELSGTRKPRTLRVLSGPQAAWFSDAEFYDQEYLVTPASNRMGLRLRAGPLRWPQRELVSEPVCPGAVQVT